MSADPFADRLARVRHRFVSTLAAKIDDAEAAMPALRPTAPMAAAAVGEGYRVMHGIVGIGPTVGFPDTGRAARAVEDVLRPAYQSGRELTDGEFQLFKERLQALRQVAARELQSFSSV
jgi:chemotaxis protein histidine kinase CheA